MNQINNKKGTKRAADRVARQGETNAAVFILIHYIAIHLNQFILFRQALLGPLYPKNK